MAVEVIHCLASVGLAVYYETRAIFGAAVFTGEFLGLKKQPSKQGGVSGLKFHYVTDVLFWNNQEMHRRLGVDVPESQKFIILKQLLGRNFSFYDFAK